MEGYLLHFIFKLLNPHELMTCMLVNHEFCEYARENAIWERHKKRILTSLPELKSIFENKPTKKKKQKTTQDIWRNYVKYLAGDIVQKVYMHGLNEQNEDRVRILLTALYLNFKDKKNLNVSVLCKCNEYIVIELSNRTHRTLKWIDFDCFSMFEESTLNDSFPLSALFYSYIALVYNLNPVKHNLTEIIEEMLY
jgi:hypothetical protein